MTRILPIVLLTIAWTHSIPAAEPTSDPAALALKLLQAQPIATGNGEVPELLRKWHKAGTAAGNAGDFYDNRDGGHSQLRTAPYPQLQEIEYSAEDVVARKHWGAATQVRPGVVFGNSSTSAPALRGGSNVRQLYASPRGLAVLRKQYRGNNLYIYPEHRDHDPGATGPGGYGGDGYGDLMPVNTPYLIASQGSSGSDQPFMKALPYALSAFRPAVKKKLQEKGLLMPTLQMILRRTSKQVKTGADYLSGAAHPVVFEGKNVDVAAMVKLAQSMTLEDLPPVVQLNVTRETPEVKPGHDYFDPASEKLTDLPEVIGRIWRGRQAERELQVSAQESFDLNGKPLTYHWVLLQGDEARVKIAPSADGVTAKITVRRHPRGSIHSAAGIRSSRVDIGVFAFNGSFYSAPAFITFLMLDNELRTYRDGRLLEVGYGAGQAVVSPVSHQKLLESAAGDAAVRKLLGLDEGHVTTLKILANTAKFQEAEIAKLREAKRQSDIQRNAAAKEAREVANALKAAAKQTPDLVDVLKKRSAEATARKSMTDAAARDANRKLQQAEAKLNGFLEADRKLPGGSIRNCFGQRLRQLIADVAQLEKQRTSLNAAIQKTPQADRNRLALVEARLAAVGIVAKDATQTKPGIPKFTLLAGQAARLNQLTRCERSMIEWYNAELIANVLLPGLVKAVFHERYVDHRLTITKQWRDVCQYTSDGTFDGYTRYYQGKTFRIGPQGVLYERLTDSRPASGRQLKYKVDRNNRSRNGSPELTFEAGEVVDLKYDGPADYRGIIQPRKTGESKDDAK